jgi:hypothetical protein
MGYLLQKSSTARPLLFLLISSTDHLTGLTGATPTVTISKSGAAFASPSGTVSEIANGWYEVAGNATDTNTTGPLLLHATATGSDPLDDRFEVVIFNPDTNGTNGLTTVGTGSGQINPNGTGGVPANDLNGNALATATQVQNIAVTSAPLNTVATGDTLTTGSVSSGTYANTFTLDGVFFVLASAAGTLDVYFSFSVGTNGETSTATLWSGYLTGITNTLNAYAYNWTNSAWDQIGTVQGGTSTVTGEQDFDLTNSHTSSTGVVRIRFYNTGLTTASLYTDRILVGYAQTNPANFASLVISNGQGIGTSTLAAGAQMDLVNAPNATAITAIQSGLSKPGTAQTITPADTTAAQTAQASIAGIVAGTTVIAANLEQILGSAITGTAAWLANAFSTFFNIQTPVLTTASVNQSADAGAVVTNGTYGNAQLARSNVTGTIANQTTILNAVNAITTNTARSAPRVPDFLARPTSGSVAYTGDLYLYNLQGELEDADSNTVTVAARNAAGSSLNAGLTSTTMARLSIGWYRLTYTVNSTDTAQAVYFDYSWDIASVVMHDGAATEVQDAENYAYLSAIKAQTDKFAFDGSNYVKANSEVVSDKTGYALTGAEHTNIAADAQTGLTAQGYTTTRSGYLDMLNGIVAAIWNALTSAMTTSGSIGLKLANWVITTPPTAAQNATAVWQDATAGDFAVNGSAGKQLMTVLPADIAAGGGAPTAEENASAVWTDLLNGGDFGTTGSIGLGLASLRLASGPYPYSVNVKDSVSAANIPGAQVTATIGGMTFGPFITDGSGNTPLFGLPGGTCTIVIWAAGYETLALAPFTVNAGQNLNQVLVLQIIPAPIGPGWLVGLAKTISGNAIAPNMTVNFKLVSVQGVGLIANAVPFTATSDGGGNLSVNLQEYASYQYWVTSQATAQTFETEGGPSQQLGNFVG